MDITFSIQITFTFSFFGQSTMRSSWIMCIKDINISCNISYYETFKRNSLHTPKNYCTFQLAKNFFFSNFHTHKLFTTLTVWQIIPYATVACGINPNTNFGIETKSKFDQIMQIKYLILCLKTEKKSYMKEKL